MLHRKLRRSRALASSALVVALASPASAADENPDTTTRERTRPVEVGVLGGVGFPRPLAVEPVVRIARRLMIGAEYGFMPTVSVQNVDARLWAVSGDARVFPFGGAFFVGVRGGYQRASADATLAASGLGSATASVDMQTWFVNPRVGFLWTWRPVAIGVDAGLQIPVSTEVNRSPLIAALSPEADARITSAANALGRQVLPTVDLLRVGLLF